jgi:hypothetical protein
MQREKVTKRETHQQATAKLEKICDMKFLCHYIESKASEAGVDTSDVGLDNVRKMFKAAVKELIIPGERNHRVDQLKW